MSESNSEKVALVSFKTVRLFKDQTLGIGSYGKVCKAKCDDLLCAAKLIHETLFDPTAHQLIAPQREHRLPMRRFEQECDFLSTIRHPNIVQYLGIYKDPDTGLPALLMELMDNSLTHFLESSTQPISYHIQVNICHDITLALSFLHSNSIVHRDLSSNNVLLMSNAIQAKVTDFGMARLSDQNPHIAIFTMCPGTSVYMPPEAVQDKPVYTEKIDCFSFGVITLQILTQLFPKPGNPWKDINVNQSEVPAGTVAKIPVHEIERRQNHICKVDPNNNLLLVSLDCLKDRDVERPSAQQLCERVAALKESPEYSESVRAAEDRNRIAISEIIREKMSSELSQQQSEIQELKREKYQIIEEKEREFSQLKLEMEECEHIIAQFQRRIAELEQLKPATDAPPRSKQQSSSANRARIKMTWRKGENAPCKMVSVYNAVTDGTVLYIRLGNRNVYAFDTNTSSWSRFPNSPTYNCPTVIINNLLTLVGGNHKGMITNQLLSLTRKGNNHEWTEEFPPMPTKRYGSTALCSGLSLIVAGGRCGDGSMLQTVEVMSIATLQWSIAANLPVSLYRAPGAICDEYVYLMSQQVGSMSAYMYRCPINTLFPSYKSRSKAGAAQPEAVWNRVAAPPVSNTTFVSILGNLLAIGGMGQLTCAVYVYIVDSDSWEVVSHMLTPRCDCFAAVLPTSQVMVVGGWTDHGVTDTVELATCCVVDR